MSTLELDKELLITNIKEWLQLDNEIKTLRKELKIRREKKKLLNSYLTGFMKQSDTDRFTTKQGNLNMTKEKRSQYIGKTFLMKTIGGFFHDDPYLAKELIEHVLNNREVKEIETVKLHIPKAMRKKQEMEAQELQDTETVYTEYTDYTDATGYAQDTRGISKYYSDESDNE